MSYLGKIIAKVMALRRKSWWGTGKVDSLGPERHLRMVDRATGLDPVLVCSFSREGDEVVVVGGIGGAIGIVMILWSYVLGRVDRPIC